MKKFLLFLGAMAALGAVIMVVRSRRESGGGYDYSEWGSASSDLAGRMNDTVKSATGSVSSAAGTATETVKAAASDAADSVKTAAKDATETVKGAAKNAKEDASS